MTERLVDLNVRKRLLSFQFILSSHGLCQRLLKMPKYSKNSKMRAKLHQKLHRLERLPQVKRKEDKMREFGFFLTHEFTNMITKLNIEVPHPNTHRYMFYTNRSHYEFDRLRNKVGVMKCIKLESEIQDFEQMNGIGDNMDYRYRMVYHEARDVMCFYQALKRVQRPKHKAYVDKERSRKTFDTLYFRHLKSMQHEYIMFVYNKNI